ncbi:TrkA family potassium uptake protein [Luteolibacter pohnpeiensis]|uniref:TrkA family potassium uptake protein n=1 Tax=Luteolibacter pohnpeiensis TaxID=454153 RepID=A0A934VVZ1_9BACT|nr:TrkA family potassium uptake protein [Luteolibacter pohnpeiensis]MBK1881989.1 TrkA family potassium uptake protein [Luteolibacter pohnpeiensis]
MKYGVIGLGNFGRNLVIELSELGHEVVAVDISEAAVEKVKNHATLAVVADASNLTVIDELGLTSLDMVVVAIGKHFESSVLVTTCLVRSGQHKLFVRIVNDLHSHLLEMAGVEGTIQVESLAAAQFARRLDNQSLIRHFSVDDTHAIAELKVPASFIGKALRDVNLRQKHHLNLITVRRPHGKGEDVEPTAIDEIPTPDFIFKENDLLIIYGHERAVRIFSEDFS